MKNLSWFTLAMILSYTHFAVASQDSNTKNEGDKISFTIDANGYFMGSPNVTQEGGLASHMSLQGKSKQVGDTLINVIAEVKVRLKNGVPENCITPDGDQGISLDLVKSRGIVQLVKSGDQLFTKATSMSLCMSFKCFNQDGSAKEGCTFQPDATAEIIGGTGAFACAAGHLNDIQTRTILETNPQGQPFGSVSKYTAVGTLQNPKNCNN